MNDCPDYIRAHLDELGADAVDEWEERWRIQALCMPDARAWREGYERVCKRFGVWPRSDQGTLFTA